MKRVMMVVLSITGALALADDVDITAAVRTANKASYSMISGTPYNPIGKSHGLQCAFDGDTTTSSGRSLFDSIPTEAAPVTFQYDVAADFSPAYEIVATRFTVVRLVSSYANVTRSPSVFELLASSDGNVWTSLYAIDPAHPVTDWNTAERHEYVIPFSKRGNYRHYRLKITANNGCRETTALGLQELILTGEIRLPQPVRRVTRAKTSVFDDVYFWLRGAVDKNGDGLLDQGELVEAFHAGRPSHAFNQGAAYADNPQAIRITKKDLVMPYANKTVYQQPCIDLYQKDDTDPSKYRPGSVRLPDIFPVTNNYTVVSRVHLEGFLGGGLAMPFSLGYSWAAPGDGGTRGLPCFFRGQWNKFKLYFGDGSYGPDNDEDLLTTRSWIDLALVVHGTNITIYSCVPNRLPVVTEATGAWHETSAENARRDLWLGNGSKCATATTDSSTLSKYFYGQFHQFAVWDRTLTQNEVYEAFSWSGDDHLRYGLVDGSSDEFAGTADSVTQGTANGWYDLPPALTAAKPAVTVRFKLLNDNCANVPEVLRISAATNSVSSMIAVSVNGTELCPRKINPGKTGFFRVRKDVLTKGENTLVITRMDGGSEPFRFDAIGLGGGWQLGKRDDSYGEFNSACDHYYIHDGTTSHFRRALAGQPGNSGTNAFIHVCVPEELASCTRYRLTARLRRIGDANQTLKIAFNDVVRLSETFPVAGSWTDFTVETQLNELKPGYNEIRLTNDSPTGTDNSWMEIDCVRLDPILKTNDGFSVIMR